MQEQIDDDVVLLCGDFGTEGSPRRIQADRIREAFDLVSFWQSVDESVVNQTAVLILDRLGPRRALDEHFFCKQVDGDDEPVSTCLSEGIAFQGIVDADPWIPSFTVVAALEIVFYIRDGQPSWLNAESG